MRWLALCWILCGPTVLTAATPAPTSQPSAEALEFFEKRVRPVLADKCYRCHSAESRRLRGDLRVDSMAAMLRGGASKTPAIVPGKPDTSPLIRAIRFTDPDLQMPPDGKLDDAVIADLVKWVEMGAPYPPEKPDASAAKPPGIDWEAAKSFWAFVPPQDHTPPTVDGVQNPIDAFIRTRLQAEGLTPAPPADKLTLIRRATFDLTGLPPTPEEIDRFIEDTAPDAFARLVDRLLASPHYGEQWGRHWLDLVRYADTAGDSADYPIPQAYLYRNYVIKAFNDDKPYDQFLREQIAGDLLPSEDETQRQLSLIATGFVAIARRFAVNPETQMHLTIEDTIDTLGKTVLGLTVSCARCHDHKFDPISSEDYYRLYGIFSSTRYPFAGSENRPRPYDLVPLMPPDAAENLLAAFNAEWGPLEQKITDYSRDVSKRGEQHQLIRQLDALQATLPIPMAYAVQEGKPADARIHIRGEPGKLGPAVPRGFLKVLGGQTLKNPKASGRLELTEWLTDPKNPLTARVMVNRIWQYHFGRGLVATPSDFGTRGQPPSHPELLDWLALRFIESGWSVKAMHRLIMNTAVYTASSLPSPAARERDPENRWLSHFSRRRLTAEELRDATLAVAGTLNRNMPEGHPFPPKSRWWYSQHGAFTAVYDTPHRSVYVMQQRIRKHPYFSLFDGADTNISTPVRTTGVTPLQSLYAMNNAFVHEQSRKVAQRLARERSDMPGRVRLAYRLLLGREPEDAELETALAYLAEYREKFKTTTTRPVDGRETALASLARVLLASNEFNYID